MSRSSTVGLCLAFFNPKFPEAFVSYLPEETTFVSTWDLDDPFYVLLIFFSWSYFRFPTRDLPTYATIKLVLYTYTDFSFFC